MLGSYFIFRACDSFSSYLTVCFHWRMARYQLCIIIIIIIIIIIFIII